MQHAQFPPQAVAEELDRRAVAAVDVELFEIIEQRLIECKFVDRLDGILLQVDAFDFELLERLVGQIADEVLRQIQLVVEIRPGELRHGVDRIGLTVDVVRAVDFNAAVAARVNVDRTQRTGVSRRENNDEQQQQQHLI